MLSLNFRSAITGASALIGRAFCHLCTELECWLVCMCMGSWEQMYSKAWNGFHFHLKTFTSDSETAKEVPCSYFVRMYAQKCNIEELPFVT